MFDMLPSIDITIFYDLCLIQIDQINFSMYVLFSWDFIWCCCKGVTAYSCTGISLYFILYFMYGHFFVHLLQANNLETKQNWVKKLRELMQERMTYMHEALRDKPPTLFKPTQAPKAFHTATKDSLLGFTRK